MGLLRAATKAANGASIVGAAEGAIARSTSGASSALPEWIGQYRIRSVIGRGGMGVVYEAEQQRPRRIAALKVIGTAHAGAETLRRFELEAQVLGRLQHPGICQIYEAGIHQPAGGGPGQPFFAMELIPGVTLTRYCQVRALGLRRRLELFARVADAVQFAHGKGVIHRDLKPGNVLVSEAGEPKVLDFGVARVTDADIQAVTVQTDVGQIIGTLPYMSPEQVAGDVNELDTRSDVYALGVMLYELLAGRLPHDVRRKAIHEAARIIREEEPPRLGAGTSTGTLVSSRELRGDVETIVSKAMEKEKDRRYQTAAALAADLRRYLGDEPIAARPPSARYQMAKFARRNKVLVGGVAATIIALAIGLTTSMRYYFRAEAARLAEADALVLAKANEASANDRAEEARIARDAERARANEVQKVAEFQQAQLAKFNPPMLGVEIRHGLLRRFRDAVERERLPSVEAEERVARFEQMIADVDFTGLALHSLENHVFRQTLTAIGEQFAEQPLLKSRMLQSVGNMFGVIGLYDLAEKAKEEAVAIRRRELGDLDPDTLASIHEFGKLLLEQGRYEEARPYCEEALEGRRRVLGEEHSDTCASLGTFGLMLDMNGCEEEAEHVMREAVAVSERVNGPDHTDTIVALANLSFLLGTTGKIEEALEATAEALERTSRSEGRASDLHVKLRHKFAWLLMANGRPIEAELELVEALASSRQLLGDEHPLSMVIAADLCQSMTEQSKLAEAYKCYKEAISIARQNFGDEHADTLRLVGNFANLLGALGRWREAEPLVRDVYSRRLRILGLNHPDTLCSLDQLGAVHQALGRMEEAEASYREALERRRRFLGDNHIDTVNSIGNMSYFLGSLGRFEEAEPYYREALDRKRRVLGSDHPETLTAMNNMGYFLKSQGRLDEAEPYYRAAMELRALKLGPEHALSLQSVSNLALLYEARGEIEKAERMLRDVLRRRRAALGERHIDSLVTLGRLANLLVNQGRPGEALELMVESESDARTTFVGSDARFLGWFLTTLGKARVRVGEMEAAEGNLHEARAIIFAVQGRGGAARESVLKEIAELYAAWHAAEPGKGYDGKAAEWRGKLEAWRATTQPAETQPVGRSVQSTAGAAPANQR